MKKPVVKFQNGSRIVFNETADPKALKGHSFMEDIPFNGFDEMREFTKEEMERIFTYLKDQKYKRSTKEEL